MTAGSTIHAHRSRPIALGRFAALFALAALLSYGVLESRVVWESVRRPFCAHLAAACGEILGWLVGAVRVQDRRISGPHVSILIVGACDALNVIALFCSGVVAFPSTWRARLSAIVLGAPCLLGVNVIRIVTLFCVGTYWPAAFEIVHMYVFQVSLVAASVAMFFGWARSAPLALESPDAVRHRVPG